MLDSFTHLTAGDVCAEKSSQVLGTGGVTGQLPASSIYLQLRDNTELSRTRAESSQGGVSRQMAK